jgi:hypothetical protein
MGWFTTEKRPPCDCSGRLEAMERKLKGLDLEWSETYDKFRLLYGRISKRIERHEKAVEDAPGAPNGPPEGVPLATGNPLAARILRRPTDGLLPNG